MDFLKTFVGDGKGSGGQIHSMKEEPLEEENVELSLGLSLNGRLGVERPRMVPNNKFDDNNRLIRASSVAEFSTFPMETGDQTSLTVYPSLMRTCSLPIETEEEWKKRKELQSFYRLEAKRRRVEKLKNAGVVRGFLIPDNYETKRRNFTINGNELGRSSPPSPLPPLPRPSPFPSQATMGSPASDGSSGVVDLESQPFSGTNKDSECKSTASQYSGSGLYRSNSVASESQIVNGNDETLKRMFADMPSVSTKGEGVNGKKIDGFLYSFRKGQDVRIVCVCHGSFLTPAQFVKHGGGGDVEHPLKHIVVNPSSPL